MKRILFLLMFCVGCTGAEPQSKISTDNATIPIEKLFTDPHGVTIFRFYDDAGWHYYALGPIEKDKSSREFIQTPRK